VGLSVVYLGKKLSNSALHGLQWLFSSFNILLPDYNIIGSWDFFETSMRLSFYPLAMYMDSMFFFDKGIWTVC